MIHFFALLRSADIQIRRIPLEQAVEFDVKTVFTSHFDEYFNEDMNLEPFEVGYTPQEDTTSFVEMALPAEFSDMPHNTNVYSELDRDNEIMEIKVIFIYDEASQAFYFQNFDKRNLLSRRTVAIWSNHNTYTTLQDSNAFIIDNVVHAIHKEGKLYFKNFVQAGKVFDLTSFFSEASEQDMDEVFGLPLFNSDIQWLKDNSDSVMKKQITALKKSGILDEVKPESAKFKAAAKKVGISEDIYNTGQIVLPQDKKQCKQVLAFLNQDIFSGLLTPKQLFRTNSKKKV